MPISGKFDAELKFRYLLWLESSYCDVGGSGICTGLQLPEQILGPPLEGFSARRKLHVIRTDLHHEFDVAVEGIAGALL